MLLSLLPAVYAKDTVKADIILTDEDAVCAVTEKNASAGGSYTFRVVCENTGAKFYSWMTAIPADETLSDLTTTDVPYFDFTISRENARKGIRIQCRMDTGDEEVYTGECFVGLRPELTAVGEKLLKIDEDTLCTEDGKEFYRFSAEVTPEIDGVSYQWYVKEPSGNETLLPGLTGAKLTDAQIPAVNAENGDLLFCRAQYANGITADSECFELRLSSCTGLIIKADKTLLDKEDRSEDGEYRYLLTAFPAEEGEYEYTWMYRTKNTSTWKKAANVSETPGELETYFDGNKTNVYAGMEFRCTARAADGTESTSGVVTVYAAPFLTQDLPERVFVDRDALTADDTLYTFTLNVQARGAGNLTYQWENTLGFDAYKTVIGENGNVLTVTAEAEELFAAEEAGDEFFCFVTDENGNTVCSGKAELTLIGRPVVVNDLPETYAYKLSEYNAEEAAYSGHTFTFGVKGEYLTYEWYLSLDNGETWEKADGTKAGFKPVIAAEDFKINDSFLVKAKAIAGGVAVTESKVCRASTVPHITKQLPDVIYVKSTDTQELDGEDYYTINAGMEAYGTGKLSYQWYYWDSSSEEKDCKPFEGATSPVLTNAKISKDNVDWTSYIYCEVTDEAGNTASTVHTRITAVKPTLLTLPDEIVITEADIQDDVYSCTLTAEVKAAKDTSPVLSWYTKIGENEWTDMEISEEEASFTFTAEELLAGVQIKVCADTFGYVRSESEVCPVNIVPFFPRNPYTYTPDIGDTGTLRVEAAANGEITYQWFVYDETGDAEQKWLPLEDDDIYSGTATNELRVFIESEDTLRQHFRCEATANGHTASVNAKLEKPDIVITKALSDVPAPLGGIAKFTVGAEGMDIEYIWEMLDPKTGKWNLVSAVTGDTLTVKADSVKAFDYRFRCTVFDGDKKLSAGEAKLIRSNDVLKGDVDLDGKVSAADARLALRAAVKLENYKAGTNPFIAADWNENGKIESADARSILRRAVGLE